jgi:hypothetical protein
VKFKLDESPGRSALEVLIQAGRDAANVLQEGLGGTGDDNLFRVCQLDERALNLGAARLCAVGIAVAQRVAIVAFADTRVFEIECRLRGCFFI